MSISSDGQLCYGIKFDEDIEFPWKEDNWDLDDWWIAQCGYEPLFSLFDEQGNYLPGPRPSKEKMNEYWAHRKMFRSQHPLPIELVNYCSYGYPMYIVAVKGLNFSCSRGYPKEIDPSLIVSWSEVNELNRFVEKYISHDHEEPKWWLSSLYG